MSKGRALILGRGRLAFWERVRIIRAGHVGCFWGPAQRVQMLRFRVFKNGVAPADLDLSTAYLVGSDNVPIRGEFAYSNGEIICRKRAAGPAALTLMWEAKGFGNVMLETTRLP